jgi:alpha-amylase
MRRLCLTIISLLFTLALTAQGWPQNYGGVMLQGFYWNSYDDTQWEALEKQATDLASSFDLIWIPQSGFCGSTSMGYDDLWWFNNYNSSFGNEVQLRSMINAFKSLGLGTIADVVINHRKNVSNWVDFPRETWNGETYEMLSTDICANDDDGKTKEWASKNGYSLSDNNDTGEGWGGMRDLDHKSENVQRIVKAYLDFLLNDLGYVGFRYDMVKGYSASYTKMYNQSAKPDYSVGECWDSSNTIKNWINGTGKESAAFDFQFKYVVRNATDKNDWSYLSQKNDGNWPLVSSDFNDGTYRRWAVTFVENHDTEVRPDGSSNGPLRRDTLAANAFMLAMPGTPCVFLKHWQAYKPEIRAMIAARKQAGITNMSDYKNVVSTKTLYANSVDDKLLVAVGDYGSLGIANSPQWTKVLSGYHYAYYLASSLETAWADKGSGDFYEPFDVTLTAVSTNPNAKLFYQVVTPEKNPDIGSRSYYQGGEYVASGTTIRIDAKEDVRLLVLLVVDDVVISQTIRDYYYREPEPESVIVIPDFCKVNDGEVCAFFEAPSSWTNTIKCWAWTDSPSDNFTGGTWPGVACDELGTASNGNKVWKWTWDGKKQKNSSATKPAMIIFNNSGAPQTTDLVFSQGGYYNKDGLQGVVTPTAIQGIKSVEGLDDGLWYDLQGRRLSNKPTIKGVYIQNGKLVVIK